MRSRSRVKASAGDSPSTMRKGAVTVMEEEGPATGRTKSWRRRVSTLSVMPRTETVCNSAREAETW
jgi:hypothetical protein